MNFKCYIDYIMEKTAEMISIGSPSGYGREITAWLINELNQLGFTAKHTIKGGVICELGGKDENDAMLLEAHLDTLGAMVHTIKPDGRLKLTPVGGMRAENAEAENCWILTRDGRKYEGTCQLKNASVHVNDDYTAERNWNNVEVVIDEIVKSKDDVLRLGIMNGDYVCFEPRTRITESGYIKSRFLDDKLSSAIILGLAKYISDNSVELKRKIYAHFTIFEEVGHGGSGTCPKGVTEAWSVDMGCVGEGLECTERDVSICAKDSGGPYNYDVVSRMIEICKNEGIKYAVDIYPHYGSDVEATLRAGFDIKHGLIGPGVYASHGYERSHRDGVENTLRLLEAYLCR